MRKTLKVSALVALGLISALFATPVIVRLVDSALHRYTSTQILEAGWCAIAVVVAWWLSGAFMRMYLMAGFIVASSIQDLHPRTNQLFVFVVIVAIFLSIGKWWGWI
jgi:hypothetical protein